ncbi:hypothetical protein [Halobellus inordinatus]|uniref:hypothetical protein n=1 Tax=Halobellus inordinatus TaxID=1126236 RepID=UPI00210AB644|nr:hypothetical protein [Halobellus inordinatus]
MALDIDTPTPPDLTNRPLPSTFDSEELEDAEELRRAELEEVLRDGAWNEAFEEWDEYTDLSDSEVRSLQDAGVFEQLDFYWDPIDATFRFEVPSLPPELADEELATYATTELTDLGQTVIELLADAYLDWGDEESPIDHWSEETFSDQTPPE